MVDVKPEIPDHDIRSCFVVGPIGDRLAPYGSDDRKKYEEAIQVWDYVIEPACQALNIAPVRADRISQPGEITEQAFVRLRDDDLVIADVTGGNPNVMYELGLRHTLDKLTIQIGEKDRLPFDITVIRTIQFVRSESGLIEARDSLIESIKAGISQGGLPVTATRVWLSAYNGPSMTYAARSSEDQEEQEEEDEPGFLDMFAEAENAMPLLSQVLEQLNALLNELPALTNARLEEIHESDRRGGGAAGRLVVAQKLAEDLDDPTTRTEQIAADYVGLFERINPGISHLIRQMEESPELSNDDEAQQFIEVIKNLAESAEEGLGQIDFLASTVQELGKLSNRLRPVSRRMATALRRISNTASTMRDWGKRLEALE